MSDRSKLINRLLSERDFRAAYIRSKLDVLIPSQLRALRLRQDRTQYELAQLADMKQARISAMETPGKVNFNLDTLVRMAATHNTGLMVKFVPYSEMLGWENEYRQDTFSVIQLAHDLDFLEPARGMVRKRARRNRSPRGILPGAGIFQVPIAPSSLGASTNMVPIQQERVQMKLQFEPSELPPTQDQLADVVLFPNRTVNDLPILKAAAAAAAGAGGRYGA